MNSTVETLEIDGTTLFKTLRRHFWTVLAQNLFLKSNCMVNRRSRILLTQRSSQTQKIAALLSDTGVDSKNDPEDAYDEVAPAQPGKITRNRQGSAAPAGDTTKNVDGAGDDEEELDSCDSDNDQHFRHNAKQRRLRKQRRTRLRILLDEMSEQGHFQGSNSYLELRSVSGATRNTYRAATQIFFAMVAGLLFFLPEYGKAGDKSIPRSLRCLKGWKKLSQSFSRKPLTWPVWCAMAVEMTRLAHPLLSIMVLLSVEVLLTSLGGSEPHRSNPASSGNECSPTLGRALPQENRERSKVGAADDTVVTGSGRGELDARSLSGACESRKVPTAVPDRIPVVPRGIPEGDRQRWRRSGALPDAAFRAVVGPRSGNKGHYVLPETGTLGDNDESQAVRKARASQRHMEAPFARNPRVLPHAEGNILAGKTCHLPPKLVE